MAALVFGWPAYMVLLLMLRNRSSFPSDNDKAHRPPSRNVAAGRFRSWSLNVLVVVTGLAAVVFMWADSGFFPPAAERRAARQAILELFGEIELGMNKGSVEEAFRNLASTYLTLHKGDDGWSVNTPFEFLATNWILGIDFCEGAVSHLRIGTSDDWIPRPEGAPPDKGGAGPCGSGAS